MGMRAPTGYRVVIGTQSKPVLNTGDTSSPPEVKLTCEIVPEAAAVKHTAKKAKKKGTSTCPLCPPSNTPRKFKNTAAMEDHARAFHKVSMSARGGADAGARGSSAGPAGAGVCTPADRLTAAGATAGGGPRASARPRGSPFAQSQRAEARAVLQTEAYCKYDTLVEAVEVQQERHQQRSAGSMEDSRLMRHHARSGW